MVWEINSSYVKAYNGIQTLLRSPPRNKVPEIEKSEIYISSICT